MVILFPLWFSQFAYQNVTSNVIKTLKKPYFIYGFPFLLRAVVSQQGKLACFDILCLK